MLTPCQHWEGMLRPCQHWSEKTSKNWRFNLNFEGRMRDLQTDRQERRNCEQTRVGAMLQAEAVASERAQRHGGRSYKECGVGGV